MKLKSLLIVAVAICGAVAMTGIAGAGGAAETKVTFRPDNGDFHGRVLSPKLYKCANNRTVKVYRQRGRRQNPGREDVVAKDTSELQGDHGVWSTGNTGLDGKFYARAGRKPGCKPDASRTKHT
jgi:hypothetical protein